MDTSFAEALKELREMRGWSVSQLAYKAHMQSSTIRMLELGYRKNPQCSTLGRLSDALKVSADDILISAGMKAATSSEDLATLSPKEAEIIRAVRGIKSSALRRGTVNALLGFARGAQDADAGRR